MKRIVYVSAAMVLALVACNKNDQATDAINSDAGNVEMANDMMAGNDMTGNDVNASANGMAAAGTADTAFLTDAIKGDNAEVAAGNLAVAQGGSAKVKDFGRMLAADHGAHKLKVATLLSGAGGTATDDVPAEAKAEMAKLKALSGTAFDQAFKEAMIKDHNKDIAKYEKQAAGNDAATASLAKETLPTLRKHLAAAKAL